MGDGVVKRGCLEEKEASRECVGQSESVYQCCHSNRCNKRTPLLHEARHLRNGMPHPHNFWYRGTRQLSFSLYGHMKWSQGFILDRVETLDAISFNC